MMIMCLKAINSINPHYIHLVWVLFLFMLHKQTKEYREVE